MKKPTYSSRFLEWKRTQKTMQLRAKKNNHTPPASNYQSAVLGVIASLSTSRISIQKRSATIKIPKNFSILQNPRHSLDLIFALGKQSRKRDPVRYLHIDHSEMEKADLASEALLDLVVLELKKEARSRDRKLKLTGGYPKSSALVRFIRGIGIIKTLGIKHEYLSQKEESSLQIFSKRNKVASVSSSLSSDYRDRSLREFVDHIDKCLNRVGRRLKPDARSQLLDYAGEILGNAEEHSGRADWSLVGYYDHEDDNHACEIAIFNFGKTFAQTFNELPSEAYARRVVDGYLEEHRKQGWFGRGWEPDDLLALASLQGDISSKNVSADSDRGQGTVEIIEFFQDVQRECAGEGKGCATMAILSGSTQIYFDGTYAMKKDENGRNVIAFNKENTLKKKPDSNFVRNLGDTFFPGSVISIRFSLWGSQLQERAINA